jgi:hypothetical protein
MMADSDGTSSDGQAAGTLDDSVIVGDYSDDVALIGDDGSVLPDGGDSLDGGSGDDTGVGDVGVGDDVTIIADDGSVPPDGGDSLDDGGGDDTGVGDVGIGDDITIVGDDGSVPPEDSADGDPIDGLLVDDTLIVDAGDDWSVGGADDGMADFSDGSELVVGIYGPMFDAGAGNESIDPLGAMIAPTGRPGGDAFRPHHLVRADSFNDVISVVGFGNHGLALFHGDLLGLAIA